MIAAPRVSVVIINWNYGRYVAEAIQSVKDQTYKDLDCVIVDNGSADQSVDVIADAIRGHSQFTLHRLSRNLGHLGGALFALQHVQNDYVVFLDADDTLFPDFVKTHIHVHIGTESPTGFTSSLSVNVNGRGEVVASGNWWVMNAWRDGKPSMRDADNTVRLAAFDGSAYTDLAAHTRYVPPQRHGWCWSAGSANMYRTALMERFRPKLATDRLLGGVDRFFTPILHAITGTNLIDLPLNAYRIHGANDFSRLPALIGIRTGYDECDARTNAIGILTLVSLIDGIADFLKTVRADRYWQVLDSVAFVDRAQRPYSEREVKAAFIRQYKRLATLSGERSLIRELSFRMKRSDYLEIVLASQKGMPLLTALRRAASVEWRRKFGPSK
jgi:glycosyltransferase involved in cell wall biosynthesis